jgi:multiple sugar transport system substrate-binding protein
MGREGESVQALLPAFERRYPDIRVDVQQIPWSAAHEKLLTAYAGEALPDAFQLGNTWIPEFVALNALAELTELFSARLPADGFFPGILATNRLDGKLYGVPWYVDTRLMFFRTDLLAQAGREEPPRTWADWWAVMERIKGLQGVDRYAILAPFNEWQMPVILALQLGSPLLREGGRYGDFRGASFSQAFSAYVGLFRKGWAPAVGDVHTINLYQDFGRGLFAFYVSGPWNIAEFRRRLPAELSGRWATAPLPTADEHYPGVSLAGGASLVISREAVNKDAARKLIEFLSEPAQQVAFYRLTGDLPPRKASWNAEVLATNPYAHAFRTQLERVIPLPQIPEWERIADKIAYYAERAVRGELREEDALANLDRDVNQILEKRRWLLARSHR